MKVTHTPEFVKPALLSLDSVEIKLLEALDAKTPPVYRQQQRDAVRGDQVAQDAGLATVGAPDTQQAMVAMKFRALVNNGYVEGVKDLDGPLRYRLTQLAERLLAMRRYELLEDELALTVSRLEETRRQLGEQLDRTLRELDELRDRPWLKRLKRTFTRQGRAS